MPRSRRQQDIDEIIEAVRRDFQGPVNKTIDRLLHPHFSQYPWLILIDGLLHGMAEGDPAKSIKKFARYSAPKLIEALMRELEK